MALRQKPASIGLSLDAEGWVPVQVLLNTLDQPGPSVAKVLAPVRARIDEVWGKAQTPWESRSRTGNFIFNAPVNVTVQPGSKPGAAPTINPNSRVSPTDAVRRAERYYGTRGEWPGIAGSLASCGFESYRTNADETKTSHTSGMPYSVCPAVVSAALT